MAQCSDNEQKQLACFAQKMSARGAKILVSNSDPTNKKNHDKEFTSDFFNVLYAGYYFKQVGATRAINCEGRDRSMIKELLISNYTVEEEPQECDKKMKRDFFEWFSNFKETIVDYKYFVDFNKVYNNKEYKD